MQQTWRRQVTFWKYLWRDSQVVVPPDMLNREFPDLDSAIERLKRRRLSQREERSGALMVALYKSAGTKQASPKSNLFWIPTT